MKKRKRQNTKAEAVFSRRELEAFEPRPNHCDDSIFQSRMTHIEIPARVSGWFRLLRSQLSLKTGVADALKLTQKKK